MSNGGFFRTYSIAMRESLRVLTLTENPSDTEQIALELHRAYDVEVIRIASAEAFIALLNQHWDIVFSEYEAEDFSAIEVLREVRERDLDLPMIVICRELQDFAISAVLKAGAADCFAFGDLSRLNWAVGRELLSARARREHGRLEEQLWHAQKMEAVGRLAGGMAHDFNNLLTVITGYSDLLLSGKDLQEGQRTALLEVRRAAERGGALTQQLLTFSRRQPMTAQALHINDVIVSVQKLVRRLIGEDIEVVTIPAATRDTVCADQGRLEQVIMNLVVNARDAMPGGGTLTIEAATVHVNEGFAAQHINLKPGPHVMLAIGDTGVGMDADVQRHIFEPFYTTKTDGKGTGLGLATVYAIVQQFSGSVSVHSEKGHGTTVKVYLPVCEDVQLPPAEEKPEQAGLLNGKETILLVEDEARVRKLIRDVLDLRGYHVLEATRGEEALRIAVSHKGAIDLAVVDVVMPEMSGPELVVQIAAMRPEARVLYISGYTEEAIVHHGILDSGAAFLAKPFLPDALVRRIREVLDKSSSTGSEANSG
jgi:signal transduction histidine kinase/ActR/RegA family two-component response regulator